LSLKNMKTERKRFQENTEGSEGRARLKEKGRAIPDMGNSRGSGAGGDLSSVSPGKTSRGKLNPATKGKCSTSGI